jgi:hypothetical protein
MAPFPKFLSLGQTATKYTMRMIEKVEYREAHLYLFYSVLDLFSPWFLQKARVRISLPSFAIETHILREVVRFHVR